MGRVGEEKEEKENEPNDLGFRGAHMLMLDGQVVCEWDLLISVPSTGFLKTGCSVVIRSNGAWTEGFALSAESVMLVALKPLYVSFAVENPQHLLSLSAIYVGWHLPNTPVLSPWVCCLIKPHVSALPRASSLRVLHFNTPLFCFQE